MAECNWDPNKYGGKPCPVHGAGEENPENRDRGAKEKTAFIQDLYARGFNARDIISQVKNEFGEDIDEEEIREHIGEIEDGNFDDNFDKEFGDSKDGMFYREMEDGTVRMASNKEDLYEEPATPEQLKSEFNSLLREGLSKEEAARKMLDNYEIPEDEVYELFGVDLFDDDYDFDDWDDNAGDAREILGRIEDAETPEELEEVRETLEDWYDQGMLVWDDYNGLKEEIEKAKKQFGVDFDDDFDDFDEEFDPTRDNILKKQKETEESFNMPENEGWKQSNFGEKSFVKNEGEDNEMFIQYNGQDYDGSNQEYVAGYMKDGEYITEKFNSLQDAKEFLNNAESKNDNSQTSKPMDYNQAKSYVKQKLGVDLDEETYNLIRGLK